MKQPNFKDLIIHEDEHYIIINKPPFVATLEDRVSSYNILKEARKYCEDAQVCHRLDKETSGILVLAKHPEAYRHLSMQFENREVVKAYHAVVGGLQDFDEKEIDLPIKPLSSKGLVKIDFGQGKPSFTVVDTIQCYKIHTLVEARPFTGRMHQIRIHLSHIGAPIMGDTNYGGKPFYLSQIKRNYTTGKYKEEEPLMKRVALHAFGIYFHNLDGQPLKIAAPYPKDFGVLIKQLKKNL